MKIKKLIDLTRQQFKQKPVKSAIYAIIIVFLIGFPFINILVDMIRYSVNVPWWDQLSFVTLMGKLHDGNLTIANLWTQHNEHRILVPQAFELITGKATEFNFRTPVFFGWITAMASFGFLIDMLRRTFSSARVKLILIVALSWLLFSPIQYVNWIWGFQLAFFMAVFFTILTIWLVAYRPILTSRLVLGQALVAACITTYCNGNGLLIWPIGLAILLWRKASRSRLAWWSGVGIVMIASYLYKFHRSSGSPTFSMLIKEPGAVIKYILAYLGRNLALTPTPGRYIGLTMIVLIIISAVYIYRKGKLDKIISWLSLATYVLLTGVLAAISRLNFGVDHGFDSTSYPTISVLFVVACLVIVVYALALWMKDFSRQRLAPYAAALLILGGLIGFSLPAFISNFSTNQTNFKALGAHLSLVQNCVYTATSENDNCLLIVFPSKAGAWQGIQTLKQLHWGNFKDG